MIDVYTCVRVSRLPFIFTIGRSSYERMVKTMSKMDMMVVKEEFVIPEIILSTENAVTTLSEYIGCDKVVEDLKSAVTNDR